VTAFALARLLAVRDADVSPGVLGFLVVALLGVATYLLIRSMNRQIRRIDLPDDGSNLGDDNGDGSDSGAPARDPDGTGQDGPGSAGPGLSPR
jgi:hypothetical protein